MTILDELIKLIKARGGDAKSVYNIADAVAALVKLEESNTEQDETNP